MWGNSAKAWSMGKAEADVGLCGRQGYFHCSLPSPAWPHPKFPHSSRNLEAICSSPLHCPKGEARP